MKIFYMSDLHTEAGCLDLRKFEGTKDDVVLLVGDIGVGVHPDTYKQLLKDIAPRVATVIYIPGNHEYYGGHYDTTFEDMQDTIAAAFTNVMFDRQIMTVIGDVGFVGATLWTDMRNDDWFVKQKIREAMNDFHVIRTAYTNRRFHPDDCVEIFKRDYAFIRDSIKHLREQGVKKIVVFTHHGVTEQACLPQFRSNALNPGWMSNLEVEILAWQPTFWIHGHIHNTVNIPIDKTVILTNPRGYFPRQLNAEFDINKHIDV